MCTAIFVKFRTQRDVMKISPYYYTSGISIRILIGGMPQFA